MFRWEIATVVACSSMGVNAFDQPNVESSKKITKAKIADYQKKGKLKEGKPTWKQDGVLVYSPTAVTGASLKAVLNSFLKKSKTGGYVAINAYLPRNGEMIEALQKGDEVIAVGMIGKIVKVSDGYVGLEVANGTVIHVQKQAVTMLLPKGTFNDVAK
jgi:hypothetical protein